MQNFNFVFRNPFQSLLRRIHLCSILVFYNFFVVFLTTRVTILGFPFDLMVFTVLLFFSQSKREVDRRLEELRDHYERGHAETERKLRRELKKTKALLRDAQAVIETQVRCHPHSTPLSNFLRCFLHMTLSLLLNLSFMSLIS